MEEEKVEFCEFRTHKIDYFQTGYSRMDAFYTELTSYGIFAFKTETG